jgi:hypothetical protein
MLGALAVAGLVSMHLLAETFDSGLSYFLRLHSGTWHDLWWRQGFQERYRLAHASAIVACLGVAAFIWRHK